MGTPSTDIRDDSAALLGRLGHALSRLHRDQVCCGSVTRHQFATLQLLEAAGGLSTSEAASRLGIDLSTASRNLAVLERAGCIRRRASARDARTVRNEVTPKGRACMDALCCDERAALGAALARIPAAEQRAVQRALSLLADALDAAVACCGAAGESSCGPPAARAAVTARLAPIARTGIARTGAAARPSPAARAAARRPLRTKVRPAKESRS